MTFSLFLYIIYVDIYLQEGEIMYNPQLETFIKVADAGSFNKAAEESYITPIAVIKQINLLESSQGVKLFERTHQGDSRRVGL